MPTHKNYAVQIQLPASILAYYRELLRMSGEQIYQKYGLKRDEVITHTAHFSNGFEADIKIVICEEDSPYVDAVLFDSNGREVACELGDNEGYTGAYQFIDHMGHGYAVEVCQTNTGCWR